MLGNENRKEENTNPHSSEGSSCSSILLKRESLNALVRAYSAIPSLRGSGSKLPMHPRSLGGRPGREDLAFQVTKSGLEGRCVNHRGITQATLHVLRLVSERRGDEISARECTVQSIKGVKAMLWRADTAVLADGCLACHRIGGQGGHGGLGENNSGYPYRENLPDQLTPVG